MTSEKITKIALAEEKKFHRNRQGQHSERHEYGIDGRIVATIKLDDYEQEAVAVALEAAREMIDRGQSESTQARVRKDIRQAVKTCLPEKREADRKGAGTNFDERRATDSWYSGDDDKRGALDKLNISAAFEAMPLSQEKVALWLSYSAPIPSSGAKWTGPNIAAAMNVSKSTVMRLIRTAEALVKNAILRARGGMGVESSMPPHANESQTILLAGEPGRLPTRLTESKIHKHFGLGGERHLTLTPIPLESEETLALARIPSNLPSTRYKPVESAPLVLWGKGKAASQKWFASAAVGMIAPMNPETTDPNPTVPLRCWGFIDEEFDKYELTPHRWPKLPPIKRDSSVLRNYVDFIPAQPRGEVYVPLYLRPVAVENHYEVSAQGTFHAARIALGTHEQRHGRVDASIVIRVVVEGRNGSRWGGGAERPMAYGISHGTKSSARA